MEKGGGEKGGGWSETPSDQKNKQPCTTTTTPLPPPLSSLPSTLTLHAQLVWVDKVERLAHGDEHLVVDPVGHALLAHPLRHAQPVLRLHVRLPPHDGGQQPDGELDLFGPGQHLVVAQDGDDAVEGGGQPLREVESRKRARHVARREDHAVLLPLQPVLDAQLPKQVLHVGVGAKEDVEPRLVRVAVGVAPRGDLAAQHVAPLQHDGDVARVGQVLGGGEAGEAWGDKGGGEGKGERGGRRRATPRFFLCGGARSRRLAAPRLAHAFLALPLLPPSLSLLLPSLFPPHPRPR